MPEDARKRRIAELLPLFKFDGVEREYFEDYSRGNKQKFVILAALLHEPRLLLVDEPMVGLDPESATTTKKIFRDFVRGGGTIFLVTHTLSLAEEISSRIGVLKKGELVFAGTIAELRDKTRRGADAPLEELYAAINV
jgi:ABC-2 type transport system ATP-binding protein